MQKVTMGGSRSASKKRRDVHDAEVGRRELAEEAASQYRDAQAAEALDRARRLGGPAGPARSLTASEIQTLNLKPPRRSHRR